MMRKWPGCGAASHGDGQSKRGLVFGACGGGGARERLRGCRWMMRRWPGCGAASCGDGGQKRSLVFAAFGGDGAQVCCDVQLPFCGMQTSSFQ